MAHSLNNTYKYTYINSNPFIVPLILVRISENYNWGMDKFLIFNTQKGKMSLDHRPPHHSDCRLYVRLKYSLDLMLHPPTHAIKSLQVTRAGCMGCRSSVRACWQSCQGLKKPTAAFKKACGMGDDILFSTTDFQSTPCYSWPFYCGGGEKLLYLLTVSLRVNSAPHICRYPGKDTRSLDTRPFHARSFVFSDFL